ncbi:MAG: DUF5667 domain-containing protein [Candidatus Paceibacterota bacterium]|jgi:hypothetical protein
MEEKLKNLIEVAKKQKMTDEEKASVYFKIETFVKNNPIQSPYLKTSPYSSRFSFALVGRAIGTVALVLILGVGGLTYASNKALPGDQLYGFKIATENIRTQFASTPARKVAVKSQIIETRFQEIKTLIENDEITPEKQTLAETSIAKEKIEIENTIAGMAKNDPKGASVAKNNLNTLIQSKQNEISILVGNKGKIPENDEEQIEVKPAPVEDKTNTDSTQDGAGSGTDDTKSETDTTTR